jgi:gamma-glutamylaminecyclotransferase
MPKSVAKSSARINPDGLGIMWLDTYEVSYHKSTEYAKLYTDRPFIAHFRYATIGDVSIENTHPFRCGNNKNEWFMMNGTINELGNKVMSDSRVLANQLGDIPRYNWKRKLEQYPCRFVTINTRTRSYQIYNKHLWTLSDGIWYSKDNVLETNYVAVYGTLKKGYSNYHYYLSSSGYLGNGKTKDKYPLIVSGLPYLINKKGTGHNLEVDVFKVSDITLANLDRLENHPKWYKREPIKIQMKSRVITCWIYFNGTDVPVGSKMHQSYNPNLLLSPTISKVSSKTPIIEEPSAICIECYNDLKYDGFNNYYCKSCLGWFSPSEVINF